MSVRLSIKNASEKAVAALKLRAKRNHRSLQGKLMAIIEEAASAGTSFAAQGLREAGRGVAGAGRHRAEGGSRPEYQAGRGPDE